MWYWNKTNFEGLDKLSQQFSEIEATKLFGEHLRLREQGLRKQAFSKLNSFLSESRGWTERERRSFVDQLLLLNYHYPKVHQLLSTPLLRGLIFPTLSTWCEEEPTACEPRRWQGMLGGPQAFENLQEALRLNPEDAISRELLVKELKRRVEYDLHHLPDFYLGDPADALSELDLIEKWDPSQADYLGYHRKLVKSWLEFKAEGGSDFAAWCQAKGHEFKWGRTFYYDR